MNIFAQIQNLTERFFVLDQMSIEEADTFMRDAIKTMRACCHEERRIRAETKSAHGARQFSQIDMLDQWHQRASNFRLRGYQRKLALMAQDNRANTFAGTFPIA